MTRSLKLMLLTAIVALAFALSLAAGKQWLPLDGEAARAIMIELRLPRAQ